MVLDGVRLGTLPAAAPFRVEAGRRTLELRAKGFHPTTRNVEVAAGGVARETVMLVALPPERPPTATASPVRGSAARAARRRRARRDPGRGQRAPRLGVRGRPAERCSSPAASALLVRKGIVDDYNNDCPGLGVAQPADCDSKIESARTWLTVVDRQPRRRRRVRARRSHARRHRGRPDAPVRRRRGERPAGRLRTFIARQRRHALVRGLVLSDPAVDRLTESSCRVIHTT